MNDIEVLLHIKTVRAVLAVDLVAAVVHCKADKRVAMAHMTLDKLAEFAESVIVGAKLAKCFEPLGTFFVHHRVIVAVVDDDKIVLVLHDKLGSLRVDGVNTALGEEEIIHFALKVDVAQA